MCIKLWNQFLEHTPYMEQIILPINGQQNSYKMSGRGFWELFPNTLNYS